MRNANIHSSSKNVYPSPTYARWSGYNEPLINPQNSLLAEFNINNYTTESIKNQEAFNVNNTERPGVSSKDKQEETNSIRTDSIINLFEENYDILGIDSIDIIKTEDQLKKEVADNEKRILKQFQKELKKVLKNDKKSNFEIAQQIKKLIGDFSFKFSINRLKNGFSSNFKPLLFNSKIDKYFTKKEDYIKVGKTEDKRIFFTDISAESVKKEVNTLYSKYFYRLKELAIKEAVIEEVKNYLEDTDIDRFPDNSLIKYIPLTTVIFDTSVKQGIYVKNGDMFLNTCNVPRIKIKLKENGKRWNIEETLEIMKKDYKRLYVLFKNLFRNDENIKYMLNKYAYFLNTYGKWTTAEVVFGIQGTGKGVFATHFIKKMVGTENYLVIGNKELKSDFNGFLEGKLFVVANEVAGDITKNNLVNDEIKALITDEDLLINEKQIKRYNTRNMFNMMFFSNAKDPVKVESSDRRFNVFKTRNEKLDTVVERELNEEMEVYIKKLDEEVDGFLPIIKGSEFKAKLVNKPLYNEYRLKLMFDTNNKYDILKDLVLEKREKDLQSFFEYLKDENELEDKIELKYGRYFDSEEKEEKYKIFYRFDISDKNLEQIKKQLMNGGFVTTEQARLLVALLYFKDIEDEDEKKFKDKINKFNKYFRTVSEVKQNYKKIKIRSVFEKEDLNGNIAIINNATYRISVENGKLKFKKIAEENEPLPQAAPEEI